MTELSLNVLDVAQNSVKAKATQIEIDVLIDTAENFLNIKIKDNGTGMSEDTAARVIDPFYTTRTTRKVGLGIPFFKMAAEMTGGSFEISSALGIGTEVKADFVLNHIDRMPLGDINSTIETLIIYNLDIDFTYRYKVNHEEFILSTAEMKELLDGVPLNNPEVAEYIKQYLSENSAEVNKKSGINLSEI